MERIQEAIEKARRERQGRIGGSAEKSDQQDELERSLKDQDSFVPQKGRKRVTDQPDGSIRVTYSDTRSVDLEEEAMKEKRIVAGFAHDARSEPYRQLRGQILKMFRANGWQTLGITSPNPSSGSTLTAVNLAISLSMETNQTVLLVDLNLRDPGVATTLGLTDVDYGIVDYVKGEQALDNILINPGFERLVVAPATKQSGFTSEVLSSPEMNRVVNEIVARYPSRIVIFDLPSVLDNDDALVFAPKCDATLMILDEGGSKKADIERAYHLLEGCNIIGSVLNKVRYQ